MPSAIEVAREFFALAKGEGCKDFTAMKLQKLLYRAQALSEYERGRPLFHETVKAWENGPVVPAVFQTTKGLYIIPYTHETLGRPAVLADQDRELVHAVWTRYRGFSGDELSHATHLEDAYRTARDRTSIINPSPPIKVEDMRNEVERDRQSQQELVEAFIAGLEARP